MLGSLGELFGLAGPIEPTSSSGALRYALIGLLGLTAAGLCTGRAKLGLGAAIALFGFTTVWWGLALGRPYGVLVDVSPTLRAAEVTIAGELGARSGIVVLEPGLGGWGAWLSSQGAPPEWILAAPLLLPVVLIPAIAIGVHLFWRRPERTLASILWLLCGSGWLDAARGLALLTNLWAAPASGIAVAAAALWLLATTRQRGGPWRWAMSAVPALSLLLATGGSARSITILELPWVIFFDQGIWVPLAIVGFSARRDRSASWCASVGLVGLVATAAGAPVDAVAAHGLYRLGLIMHGAVALQSLARRIGGAAIRAARLEWMALQPRRAGEAAIVFCLTAEALLIWWNPIRTDLIAERSQARLSRNLEPVVQWIRTRTPTDAVILASPDYAPVVAVRAARRVLRAPSLLRTDDDARRVRAERLILRGRDLPDWAERYSVTHVIAAPGDFRARGIESPSDLVGIRNLALEYTDEHGIHVFSIAAAPESFRGSEEPE